MLRPSWDDWAIGLAVAVSKRADCTRSAVGAVLLRQDRTVASTGYNGAVSGAPGCLTSGACPRGQLSYAELAEHSSYDVGPGRCHAVHAEMNCLAYAREDTAGMSLYVTREPCPQCWRLIGAHRLDRVVWLDAHGQVTTNKFRSDAA